MTLGDRIVVKPEPLPELEVRQSGMIIPASHKSVLMKSLVVSVGVDQKAVSPGDYILHKVNGVQFEYEGVEYQYFNPKEDKILCYIKND